MRALASFRKVGKRAAIAAVAIAATISLAACSSGSSDSDSSGNSAGSDLGLVNPGVLTVGMNLQFKPEMYLDDSGQPAGYDVDLLNELATALGLKLDIQNIDFNGLIPGLQSRKFDLVSAGLNATEERKRAVDFTNAYVPYASILAIREDDNTPATIENYNKSGTVITALQGSTGEQLAKTSFPNADVKGFGEQNSALLEVETGRAQGGVLEDYIFAQFQKANPGKLKTAALAQPLDVSFGSWAVQKGNTALATKLNAFLCTAKAEGTLAKLYEKNFEVSTFPALPDGGC